MLSKFVDLISWGISDLKVLCSHNDKHHNINDKNLGPLINPDLVKCDFFFLKIQSITEWMDKFFRD
jgi:hypothetical protein